jgi:hypothetical protein
MMRGYQWAGRIFSVSFVTLLLAFAGMNLYTQEKTLAEEIDSLSLPKSIGQVKNYIDGIESSVNANIWGKYNFIEWYAYLQVLMGKEENGGFDVLKGENGEMLYANFYHEIPSAIDEYAKRVLRVKNFAEKRGTKVLFLNTASMYTRWTSKFSAGLPVLDLNPDQDALLYFLHAYGVDYLDSRAVLANSNVPPGKQIYKSDHHWTIEAGFEVFKALVEKLDGEYGANLDPTGFYRDINNYHVRNYRKSFMGSIAVRGGAIFSEADDFTLIWPKFKTDFRRETEHPTGRVTEDGPFEKSIIIPKYLTTNLLNTSYATYGEMVRWKKITNKMNPNGLKLLMINDSYSLPIIAFLAPMFGEIHSIWHATPESKVDIDRYIKENDFDYIIIQAYPGAFKDDSFYFAKKPLEE